MCVCTLGSACVSACDMYQLSVFAANTTHSIQFEINWSEETKLCKKKFDIFYNSKIDTSRRTEKGERMIFKFKVSELNIIDGRVPV